MLQHAYLIHGMVVWNMSTLSMLLLNFQGASDRYIHGLNLLLSLLLALATNSHSWSVPSHVIFSVSEIDSLSCNRFYGGSQPI